MATIKFCIATVLLSFQAANSYVLLTANVEDVHAIAKQLADSPLVSQFQKIIYRAADIFNQHAKASHRSDRRLKKQKRSEANLDDAKSDNEFEVWKPRPKDIIGFRSKMSESSSTHDGSSETNSGSRNRLEGRRQVQAQKTTTAEPDLLELGKNASFYLKSIKKIFENV